MKITSVDVIALTVNKSMDRPVICRVNTMGNIRLREAAIAYGRARRPLSEWSGIWPLVIGMDALTMRSSGTSSTKQLSGARTAGRS